MEIDVLVKKYRRNHTICEYFVFLSSSKVSRNSRRLFSFSLVLSTSY